MSKLSKIVFSSLIFIFTALSSAENITASNINSDLKETYQRIDINHADVETLSLLKGVGLKKAEAIVKYRSETGKFSSLEDLLNVKGIGKKILALNKTQLKV
jgi:competence protein ComEA